ncbi:MAG: hypothetical protein OEZ12_02695 [Candidatus Bathyarchaeota archaeon]|nr:hypothetical protein [Candidatus Bathyarchaeota archaeon]
MRRLKGILRLAGLSQRVDSWFRISHRRDRAEFFRCVFVVILVVALLLALIIVGTFRKEKVADVFVGVEVGYDNVDDIVRFVDEVGEYVNLVVIGSLNVTINATKLTTVCDYLYNKGLYFVPFMFLTEFLEKADFFQVAKERWGERFLGVYVSDEPGGRQFDMPEHRVVNEAENYSDAASKYVRGFNEGLQQFFARFVQPGNVTTFVADYALYWFDYKAGWDVVFAEFGWNFSRQLHIALCRGAARVQSKEWGVIVTWTYRNSPFIEDAEELYRDLVLAYNNGAKYTIVFNYPTNETEFGVLTREHLNSMKKFWNYVNTFPQPKQAAKTAYVLPEDYGYGFRGPDDKIWGLWGPDELSPKVWNEADSLLTSYGAKLDLVYETTELDREQQYEKLIFWNGTTIQR